MKILRENLKPGDFLKKPITLSHSKSYGTLSLSGLEVEELKTEGPSTLDIFSPSDHIASSRNPQAFEFYRLAHSSLGAIFRQFEENSPSLTLNDIEFLADNLVLEMEKFPHALLISSKNTATKKFSESFQKHSLDTALNALLISRTLPLTAGERKLLSIAGLLHDCGLFYLPEFWEHQGRFIPPETRQNLKKHPGKGALFVKKLGGKNPLLERVILQHHERIDGLGYPSGLKGDQILPISNILALSEVYTSLCSPAPKRRALASEKALRFIQSQLKTHFRGDYLKALQKEFGFFPPGETLLLKPTDQICEVLKPTGNPFRPLIWVPQNGKVINLNYPENQKLTLERTHQGWISTLTDPGEKSPP